MCAFLWIDGVGVPPEPRVPGVLRRTVLDNVEASDVRVHGRFAGDCGGERVQEGVPGRPHPYHRIRQQPSSPVHQFHRLQATQQRQRVNLFSMLIGS